VELFDAPLAWLIAILGQTDLGLVILHVRIEERPDASMRARQEANRKLLSVPASRRRPFIKINTGALVRANMEAQYRAFALGRQWGWLSVNDIRRLIDLEPIGPAGDFYLQPMNMEPLGVSLGEDGKDESARRSAALRVV
jgi:hypothetical protein